MEPLTEEVGKITASKSIADTLTKESFSKGNVYRFQRTYEVAKWRERRKEGRERVREGGTDGWRKGGGRHIFRV